MLNDKETLMQCFEYAIKNNIKYIAVEIETRGTLGREIIINPMSNFEFKKNYYNNAYDDNLILKSFNGIRITDFSCGDDVGAMMEHFNNKHSYIRNGYDFSMCGTRCKNKNSGAWGVITSVNIKTGQVQVIEKIAPLVICTHDNMNTLEIMEG